MKEGFPPILDTHAKALSHVYTGTWTSLDEHAIFDLIRGVQQWYKTISDFVAEKEKKPNDGLWIDMGEKLKELSVEIRGALEENKRKRIENRRGLVLEEKLKNAIEPPRKRTVIGNHFRQNMLPKYLLNTLEYNCKKVNDAIGKVLKGLQQEKSSATHKDYKDYNKVIDAVECLNEFWWKIAGNCRQLVEIQIGRSTGIARGQWRGR